MKINPDSTYAVTLAANQRGAITVSLRAYHALVSGPTNSVYYPPRAERLVALETEGQWASRGAAQ